MKQNLTSAIRNLKTAERLLQQGHEKAAILRVTIAQQLLHNVRAIHEKIDEDDTSNQPAALAAE